MRGSTNILAINSGGGLVLLLLLCISGCAGPLVEFSASPATVQEHALEQTDYHHLNTTEIPVTYPGSMGGLSEAISVRTWLAVYSPAREGATAGFVVYSSPDVVIAGESLNPLSQLSNRELTQFVLERVSEAHAFGGYTETSGLEEVGVRNVSVLGSRTDFISYAGRASIEDQEVSVTVNLVTISHGSDVIVAIGVHESAIAETGTHAELVREIEHEG